MDRDLAGLAMSRRWLSPVVGVVAGLTAIARFAVVGNPADTLWAEDGTEFLNCALSDDPAACPTTRIQGYLNVGARLLTAPVRYVPLEYAALWIMLAAAFGAGLCAGYIAWRAARVGLLMPAAAAAGISIVVIPAYGTEVAVSLANLQWVIAPVAFWALVPSRWPESKSANLAGGAIIFAAILSAPAAIFALPVAIFRAFQLRRQRSRIFSSTAAPLWGYTMGSLVAVSVFALHRNERTIEPSPWSPAGALRAPFDLAVALFVRLPNPTVGYLVTFLTAAAVIVLAGVSLVGSTQVLRRLAALSILTSAFTLGMTVVLQGNSSRYWFVSVAMLMPAVITAVTAGLTSRSMVRRTAATVLALGIVIASALQFPVFQWRADGPDWSAQVVEAHRTCATGNGTASLLIAPSGYQWRVVLPCAIITDR